ncbi:MAG TPA: APC family permease [Candidatus Binatus sp.]|nr:APC family permease [Candidatus Binatus sp.]
MGMHVGPRIRPRRFSKDLGLLDTIFLGIGFVVGSGIFLFPIVMAGNAGTYSLVSWVIGGIYTILTGLCFAENAVRVPKVGGLYAYAHQAFGDKMGFLAGWSYWIGYCATISTETAAVAVYSKYFLPSMSDMSRLFVALTITFLFIVINHFGVKSSGKAEDLLTVGKLIPLVAFIIIGLFFVNTQNYYPLAPTTITTSLPASIGAATILALWAYLGVEIIAVPFDEIKDAKKTVPRAIMATVLIVMAVFLAVSAVALGMTRYEAYLGSGTPLADIIQATSKGVTGSALGLLLGVGGMIAIIGSINAVVLGTPRISYAMARDKLFPRFFAYISPKRKTPTVGILVETIIGVTVLLLVKDLQSLASLAVMYTIIPYLVSSLATIQFIRKDHWKTHIIKTRWVPFIATAASILLFFYFKPQVLLVGVILLLLGVPVYLSRKRFALKTETSSKREPGQR